MLAVEVELERLANERQKLKEERRRMREEKRKQKVAEKLKEVEEKKMERQIQQEERKLLIAQRKLESIRLIEEMLHRVKVYKALFSTLNRVFMRFYSIWVHMCEMTKALYY